MLRNTRIVLATVFFICITLLFVGIGQQWWGWMAKLQFLPSALALNLLVVAGIIVLTLLFGRIYCSVICPMGVFQDSVNWLSSRRKGKKRRFHFKKECKWLRWTVWAVTVLAIIFGIQIFVAIIGPYSAYGRIVRSIVEPSGLPVIAVAAITLVVIFILAWLGGRTYCNTICPVGTTLGLFSRFSLFKVAIDPEKCIDCHSCEKQCKASCINSTGKVIDYSRCVTCFDCIKNCKSGAIRYKLALPCKSDKDKQEKREDTVDEGKRAFIAGAALLAGTALTSRAQNEFDGGLAEILPKKKPQRAGRLVPFGAKGEDNFFNHCTACQLCVSNCPNGVLRPSSDLKHLMQPEMGYEKGYCRPECTVCSQVCPAGAILPITPEEKSMIHIGRAVVDYDLCVVNRDSVSCGNCSRHCPAGAILMVAKDPSDRRSLRIPAVDETKCIGCGACENLCPSRPISAIHIDGLKTHIS